MSLLELHGLNKHFGGLHVTNAVDLALEAGEIHCLIGPNGAGKSTLFRLILGEHHPGSGDILFAGENITALKSFARIHRGLSVKFQVPGVSRDCRSVRTSKSPCNGSTAAWSSRARSTGCWHSSTSKPIRCRRPAI